MSCVGVWQNSIVGGENSKREGPEEEQWLEELRGHCSWSRVSEKRLIISCLYEFILCPGS